MLPATEYDWAFGLIIIAMVIFVFAFRFWQRNRENELEKALSFFRVNIIFVGILCILLWFMLPSATSLGTYGLPETVSEIESDEQLLHYLKKQNEAIARTIGVVGWFIFLFIWLFLVSLYTVVKALSDRQGKKYFENVRKRFDV